MEDSKFWELLIGEDFYQETKQTVVCLSNGEYINTVTGEEVQIGG